MSTSALANISWDEGAYNFQRKLGNFVQYFQVNLPTNGYGVPLQLINPIVIAPALLECETTDDVPDTVVETSLLQVDFDDGMPIVDGTPIWERFDGEHLDYYKAFKIYREMLYNSGSRAIARLASTINVTARNLMVLSKVYHWQLRCRAYDQYLRMAKERERLLLQDRLMDRHEKAANQLLTQALTYLENHPEQMNPKIAVQMLQVAFKAGRLAVGLNPEKPGSGDSAPSINIHNTSNGGAAETSVAVDGQGQGNSMPTAQDLGYLQSVLHILDKSGALDKTRIVDADFTVVGETSDSSGAS